MNQVQHTSDELFALLHQRVTEAPFCKRILHGRGKLYAGLESVNVEWYPPYIFVQNFSDALPSELETALVRLHEQTDSVDAVLVQSREWPDFITKTLCAKRDIELPLVFNAPLAPSLHWEVKLGENRNTGVFLDMRAGWTWVNEFSQDKRVLNLFSYTGVFSLFALAGGGIHADNVDMAANVLKISQRNHQSNALHDGKTAFYKRDILKSQRWFESREPYDLIILDPPPYQKKAFRGWQDYIKLLKFSRLALKEGGTLLCSLNNPQIDVQAFQRDLQAHFGTDARLEVIDRASEIEELHPNQGLKLVAVHI